MAAWGLESFAGNMNRIFLIGQISLAVCCRFVRRSGELGAFSMGVVMESLMKELALFAILWTVFGCVCIQPGLWSHLAAGFYLCGFGTGRIGAEEESLCGIICWDTEVFAFVWNAFVEIRSEESGEYYPPLR